MTRKSYPVCASAALTLFTFLAVCNSDARASHDAAAEHDGQAIATQPTTSRDASDPIGELASRSTSYCAGRR